MEKWNNGMIDHRKKSKKKNGINQCFLGFNALHPLSQYSNIPVFDSIFADTDYACLPVGRDTVTVF
jgi:hypothetical protein